MTENDDLNNYSIGAHVIIRDAEWRITGVAPCDGDIKLTCIGLSDLVNGRKGIFFTRLEKDIQILIPEQTKLVQDSSPGFIKSKLYFESVLRTSPKTDNSKIYIADRAAMDPLPFQFDPAMMALSKYKPRILIADAVGIGKTLEAGILTSELIARGLAGRILVVVTKAMLLQFQQEFWNRFAIPLCRLDNVGISRCLNRIPSNRNPFDYFDKAIISVDTLKQDKFLAYLDNARWDLIIIDEAHNVADRRGTAKSSMRSHLARRLSRCSDSMIMLTATPHDGNQKSFASLLNILDRTAVVDTDNYTADDFVHKNLVIRRFKADICNQVEEEFKSRKTETFEIRASSEENCVFESLAGLFADEKNSAKAHDSLSFLKTRYRNSSHLLSSILTKEIFSSPDACQKTLVKKRNELEKKCSGENQTAKLSKSDKEKLKTYISKIKTLIEQVEKITPDRFSKFQFLIRLLNNESVGEKRSFKYGWNKDDSNDRLVIFTESIPTLEFLSDNLPEKIGLDKNQVAVLHGSLAENEIADIVNDFNKKDSSVRLLLCSDVASEGVNLHHYSHRMIHFDLPWSLMTFQQRNGRIDRYGQKFQPSIIYLQTLAENDKIRDDAGVLKKLEEKDRQAQINIDDPSAFAKSEDEQINDTFDVIEGNTPGFDSKMNGSGTWDHGLRDSSAETSSGAGTDLSDENSFDLTELLFGDDETDDSGSQNADPIAEAFKSGKFARVMSRSEFSKHLAGEKSLFSSDFDFVRSILEYRNGDIGESRRMSIAFDVTKDESGRDSGLMITLTKQLKMLLPPDIVPENGVLELSGNVKSILREIDYVRTTDSAWPSKQLLYPLHPVVSFLTNYALSVYGRNSAPVLGLSAVPETISYVNILDQEKRCQ